MHTRVVRIGFLVLGTALLGLFGLVIFLQPDKQPATHTNLQIVAAENFWGSLAGQIGGSHAQVRSMVTDPNADPHDYESTVADARAIANANYVISNGAGYDSWADKLVAANPSSNRLNLRVAQLIGASSQDNPHFWYNPAYVNRVAERLEQDFIRLDPANTAYYHARYGALQQKLSVYQATIAHIKQRFAGTPVAATEDIFAYFAQASGLQLISPPTFMQAVAEDTDPPTNSFSQFQQQLQGGAVRLFIYNQQTITPLTESLQRIAIANHIPTVGITETIQPASLSFSDWMQKQSQAILEALQQP